MTQTLGELKSKYQDAYLTAHERARLGVNDDKRKASLTKDSRDAQLQKLGGVDMMPTPQLRDFEKRLFALKSCFQLGRPDLEGDPLAPIAVSDRRRSPLAPRQRNRLLRTWRRLWMLWLRVGRKRCTPISKIPRFRRTLASSATPWASSSFKAFLGANSFPIR